MTPSRAAPLLAAVAAGGADVPACAGDLLDFAGVRRFAGPAQPTGTAPGDLVTGRV